MAPLLCPQGEPEGCLLGAQLERSSSRGTLGGGGGALHPTLPAGASVSHERSRGGGSRGPHMPLPGNLTVQAEGTHCGQRRV